MKDRISNGTRVGRDLSIVGMKWRTGNGKGKAVHYGIDEKERKKRNSDRTFSSLGGLDWDLDRIFPAPPLPEEKSSPSGWGETRA